jgi:hypothetical protein
MSDEFIAIEKLLTFPDPEFSQKKILEMFDDRSLEWWRESLACLRPPSPPDDGTTAE